MATQYPPHHIEFVQKLSTSFVLNNTPIYATPLVKQASTKLKASSFCIALLSRLLIGAAYTSRISKCLPQASAYLRKVATEGDCLSLAIELSKRETAGGLVPMR